jgi:hypothetical protein
MFVNCLTCTPSSTRWSLVRARRRSGRIILGTFLNVAGFGAFPFVVIIARSSRMRLLALLAEFGCHVVPLPRRLVSDAHRH